MLHSNTINRIEDRAFHDLKSLKVKFVFISNISVVPNSFSNMIFLASSFVSLQIYESRFLYLYNKHFMYACLNI